ncbi:TIGR02444 family protein [Pleionea sediminis]|uniref:TIGR02444 family protein n=1 Tax=Pleionea sediminis TaxID=2569479 RepID=UPI001185A113|nr:TIGR02444 family protein [Pleionea sediminis]
MTESAIFDRQQFWQFSFEFYQQDNIEEACLKLQDDFDLNINVILFLLWYSTHAQKVISTKQVEGLLDAISVADERVQEFRQFRKTFLAKVSHQEVADMHDVRQALLDTELTLESKVQHVIIEYANEHLILPGNVEPIVEHPIELDFVAHENLDIYCRYLHPETCREIFQAQQDLINTLIHFPFKELAA